MKNFLIISTLTFTLFINSSLAKELTEPSTKHEDVKKGFYALDKSHAKILFSVSHLGFSNFYSEFKDFDAKIYANPSDLAQSYVEVEIAAESADSGNKVLNGKFMDGEFFNVKKHPKITFKSTKIELADEAHGKLTGSLTFLGVSKMITLDVTFNGTAFNKYAGKPVIGFSATGVIKRSQFGMNAYLPAVSDEVNLIIETEFTLDEQTKYPKK